MDRQKALSVVRVIADVKVADRLLTVRQARKLTKQVLVESKSSKGELKAILSDPEKFLGEYSSLPQAVRLGLSQAATFYDMEQRLTHLGFCRDILLSPLWFIGNAFLSAASPLIAPTKPNRRNRCFRLHLLWKKSCYRLGRLFTTRALRLAKSVCDPFYRRPFFCYLWVYLDIDVPELCHAYLEGIPPHPKLGPIYHCRPKRCECAVVLSLDLLPSGGELYFVEANFNTGFGLHSRTYRGVYDFLWIPVVQYAKTRGFRNVLVYGQDLPGYAFRKCFKDAAESWQRITEEAGLAFDVVDYKFSGRMNIFRTRFEIDNDVLDDTLIILLRAPVASAVTRLVSEKGHLETLIRANNSSSSSNEKVSVPETFSVPGRELMRQPDQRYPNLIVKNKKQDEGAGIYLFNVDRIPDSFSPQDHLFSRFEVSDGMRKQVNGVPKDFVCDYRALLLLTPQGPVYMGAYKRASSVPVPQRITEGRLTSTLPFVTNVSLGGTVEKLSEEEGKACKKVSGTIGRIIFRYVRRKYAANVAQSVEY